MFFLIIALLMIGFLFGFLSCAVISTGAENEKNEKIQQALISLKRLKRFGMKKNRKELNRAIKILNEIKV
ncbi:MAG: hypothetical protein ACOCP4_07705 [Candidatus Woesearchaeota archaeon]